MKLKIQENNSVSTKPTQITRDMPIAEVITVFPSLAEILTEDYGFHCVGCFASTQETLEQGAAVHGMSEEEVEEMIVKLNKLI